MTNKEAAQIVYSVMFMLDKEYYSDAVEEALQMAIKALEERQIGRWVATENEEGEIVGYFCSVCDLPMETDEKTDYCQNCGARMVE